MNTATADVGSEVTGTFTGMVFNFWFLIVVIIVLMLMCSYHWYFWRSGFYKIWNETLDSLKSEANTKGLELVKILIEISYITAENDAKRTIGRIEEGAERDKGKTDFYKNLIPIILKIQDNNRNIGKLNGDYAKARNAMEEIIKLIEKFADVSDFENFVDFSIQADKVEKEMAEAVKNMGGILYSLTSKEIEISTDEVVAGAIKHLNETLYVIASSKGIAKESGECVLTAVAALEVALTAVVDPPKEAQAIKILPREKEEIQSGCLIECVVNAR